MIRLQFLPLVRGLAARADDADATAADLAGSTAAARRRAAASPAAFNAEPPPPVDAAAVILVGAPGENAGTHVTISDHRSGWLPGAGGGERVSPHIKLLLNAYVTTLGGEGSRSIPPPGGAGAQTCWTAK